MDNIDTNINNFNDDINLKLENDDINLKLENDDIDLKLENDDINLKLENDDIDLKLENDDDFDLKSENDEFDKLTQMLENKLLDEPVKPRIDDEENEHDSDEQISDIIRDYEDLVEELDFSKMVTEDLTNENNELKNEIKDKKIEYENNLKKIQLENTELITINDNLQLKLSRLNDDILSNKDEIINLLKDQNHKLFHIIDKLI